MEDPWTPGTVTKEKRNHPMAAPSCILVCIAIRRTYGIGTSIPYHKSAW